MRRLTATWVVPVAALVALLISGGWLALRGGSGDSGPVGSGGAHHGRTMMDGAWSHGWQPGDGRPVAGLAAARTRAQRFAEQIDPGLRVGEVMRFTRNYYAEIEQHDGTLATEVLIDPVTGAVGLEYGPARMWNTRYGMMRPAYPGAALTPRAARAAAARWAADRGLTVGEPDAFPGYYTFHTFRDGRLEGMLSVNGRSAAVWYHSWHGKFVSMAGDRAGASPRTG